MIVRKNRHGGLGTAYGLAAFDVSRIDDQPRGFKAIVQAPSTARARFQEGEPVLMIQTTFDDLLRQAPRDSAYDRLMTAKAEGRRAMAAVANSPAARTFRGIVPAEFAGAL